MNKVTFEDFMVQKDNDYNERDKVAEARVKRKGIHAFSFKKCIIRRTIEGGRIC